MPKKARGGSLQVGQRVFLGGEISRVGAAFAHGFQEGTVKLDKFQYPITVRWTEPDSEKIMLADQLERPSPGLIDWQMSIVGRID